jgi:hypothetical protein
VPQGAIRPGPPRRPLPDPAAVRLVTVPLAAPPFDDAVPSEPEWPGSPDEEPTESEDELTWPRGELTPMVNATPAHASGNRAADEAAGWPTRFAQVLAETLAGARPPSQLTPWTTEQARKRISQLSAGLAASYQPRVKRVIVRSPADGVLEIAVIFWLGTRARALAIRLESTEPAPPDAGHPDRPTAAEAPTPQRPRWQCTAIEAA